MMLSKSKGYAGCILATFGMAVAFLAAEPWSFHAILQFFIFDVSPNQPVTGLGFAIAAIGGIMLASSLSDLTRRGGGGRIGERDSRTTRWTQAA